MTTPVYQWQPSTAEIARRAGIAPEEVIRFDHNTSPTAPPWAPEEAAIAGDRLNEYPAADYRRLREAAGAYAGVDAEQVVPGAGVDELIGLAALAFLPAGGSAVAAEPTYTLYRIATMQRGGTFTALTRRAPDFGLPAALADAAATADLTWLCVPHNPTGRREPDQAIAAVIEAASGTVVVDAAYAQFAGDRWAPLVERHRNLVVLHTLSKAFGLAGIRVGYSLSSPELAARLHAVRPPGSISTGSAALAIRALAEPGLAVSNVASIVAERDRMRGCSNDNMAIGAVAAIRQAGKSGEIQVIGFDNIDATHELLKSGDMLATGDQYGDKLAIYGIEYALQIQRDGVVPANKKTPVKLVTADDI